MLSFKEFFNESVERVNRPEKTQVATTGGTYRKTGEFLKDKLPEKARVISVGAGLDQTREGLHAGLDSTNTGHVVHDHEPYPQNRKVPPDYTDGKDIPKDHYHAGVSHNVLNVLQPHEREHVMHHLFNSVKAGGHIVIGTRGYKGDIDQTKNSDPGEEKGSVWVKRKFKNKETGQSEETTSYQKGFDGDELKNYAEDYARRNNHHVTVKKIPGLAKSAIHIQIHSKGTPTE